MCAWTVTELCLIAFMQLKMPLLFYILDFDRKP
jgi:hypothetical protein